MGRSQETNNKKEIRNKKEKKRKEKEKRRQARKGEGKSSLDDMIAYVDEQGNISSTPPDPDQKEEIDPEDIQIGAANRNDNQQDDPEKHGTVIFFNDEKGFGFIKDTASGKDVFVHINNVQGDIKEGNAVSFEVEKGPKGLNAVNVKLVK